MRGGAEGLILGGGNEGYLPSFPTSAGQLVQGPANAGSKVWKLAYISRTLRPQALAAAKVSPKR